MAPVHRLVRAALALAAVALGLALPAPDASAFTGSSLTVTGSRSASTDWVLTQRTQLPLPGSGGTARTCDSSHHRVLMGGHFIGLMLRDPNGKIILNAFAVKGMEGDSPAACPTLYFASDGGRVFDLAPGRYRVTLLTDRPATIKVLGLRGVASTTLRPTAPARLAHTAWSTTTSPSSELRGDLRVTARTFGIAIAAESAGGTATAETFCFEPKEIGCGPEHRADYVFTSTGNGSGASWFYAPSYLVKPGADTYTLTTVTDSPRTTHFSYFAELD